MSEDLFDFGKPNGPDSDDWEDGLEKSDSESEPAKPNKGQKRRRSTAAKKLNNSSSTSVAEPQQPLDDADDHLTQELRQRLQHEQLPSEWPRHNVAEFPRVLNSDDVNVSSVTGTSNKTPGAAGGGQVDMTVLGSKTQEIADANRRLREKLELAQQQLEEQEDSYEGPEALAQSPEPAMRQLQPIDDHLDPDEVDYVDTDPGAAPAQTVVAADSRAGAHSKDGKLPLSFKTQGQENVTVRIDPAEPLQAALKRVREHACEQRWGVVSKFLSPDGDKLTGNETAQDLGLEAEDVIEVYLSRS